MHALLFCGAKIKCILDYKYFDTFHTVIYYAHSSAFHTAKNSIIHDFARNVEISCVSHLFQTSGIKLSLGL